MNHYSRFRHLALERAKPAPTAAEIAAIETLLGAKLPNSFREFLEVANGASMEYFVDITFEDGTSESLSFCSIFSTEEGDFCDETFVGEIRAAREYQGVPVGVLPFARDAGDSMVYLDLSPEGKGRVVAFVQGLPEWTGLRTEPSLVEVASSFDEYVEKLWFDRENLLENLESPDLEPKHIDATEEWLDISLPAWRSDTEIATAVADARRRVNCDDAD